MEGKIKYGMFDLTIGIDLQHELVGLLEQKNMDGKVIAIKSEDIEVNKFLKELYYFKEVLRNYTFLLCTFDTMIWSYKVLFLERRKKMITSYMFDGYNVSACCHDPDIRNVFSKMEQSLKVMFAARNKGLQKPNILEKINDGYSLEIDFDGGEVSGKLVKKEGDVFSDMIYIDNQCLQFIEEVPFDKSILPLEYGIEMWYDKDMGMYQSSLSFKEKKGENYYSYEQLYGVSDTSFEVSLLNLSDKVNEIQKEKVYGKK